MATAAHPVFSGRFEKVVLILSTGRTGTQALAAYLDKAFTDVRAVHEPHESRMLRVASNRYLAGRLSAEDLVRKYAKRRKRFFTRFPERFYIESNSFLHGFLEAFNLLFDDFKIIHVVRDPRTYVPSHLNHGTLAGLKGLASRYFPYWMIKPEYVDKFPPRRWVQMSDVEKLAWRWKVINAELNRGAEIHADRYVRLKYEDLFASDGSGFQDLLSAIGLKVVENPAALVSRRINVSTRKLCPGWDEMREADRSAVLENCTEMMSFYGYPLDQSS